MTWNGVRVGIRQYRTLCVMAGEPDDNWVIADAVRTAHPTLDVGQTRKVVAGLATSRLVDRYDGDGPERPAESWVGRITQKGLNARVDVRGRRLLLQQAYSEHPEWVRKA